MMQLFTLKLSDNGTLVGRLSIPAKTQETSQHLPLIICIHGGSYDAEYFDMDAIYSISSLTEALKIPVIAISRPGYGGSTPLPLVSLVCDDTTFAQEQGKYLNSTILPALWKEYGKQSGATSIVLLTHSIGAMVGLIAAGSYTGMEGYPLAGLITSGISSRIVEWPRQRMINLISKQTEMINYDPAMKDAMMLQLNNRSLADPEVCKYTKNLNKPIPAAELYDINITWPDYWHNYAAAVKIPLMCGVGEFDGLWVSSPEAVEEYKSTFTASPRIEGGIVPMAPHNIEMSYQSKGWLVRCCGFAVECAVWRGLLNKC
jgi:pimeloyl-ACP methyl ester carboxylesterase